VLRTRTIGEYKVSSITEYIGPTHDPQATFPDFNRAGLDPHLGWIAPDHYAPAIDRFIIGIQIWVVQAGSEIILIDTGVGNHKPRFTERANMLNTLTLHWLAAAGATREKVTHVVMTHLHADHVGWNTMLVDRKWVPTFPNARYYFPKDDYAAFKEIFEKVPFDGGSFFDSVMPVVQAGNFEFVDNQTELAGCLQVEKASGHTPGMLNYRLRSRGEEGVFCADIFHSVIQIANPSWNTAFCILPEAARQTRAAFLARQADNGALVLPCHFGVPHCGYIRKQADGYAFEPATW
jgi:glyoxylase-like metal-dependent hydrolase (beta-lactamase superfamily II)